MNSTIIKGAILGGLIAFVWAILSWMVLPWHKMSMRQFTNEQTVMTTVMQNAPVSGIYVMPTHIDPATGKCNGGAKGPFMFATVKLEGMDYTSYVPFVRALLIQILAAGIITWIILHARAAGYIKKVAFIVLIAFLVGVLGKLPDWNWMGVPFAIAFYCIVDLVIAWFLAGLVIAKFCQDVHEHPKHAHPKKRRH
jgi:hypothetical protein